MLDNTGSMSNDMQALRDAASDLADDLLSLDGDSLRQLIEEERSQTSWGASVADAARRAVAEINAAQQSSYDEFAQIETLLRRHPAEHRSNPGGEI